MKHYDAIIIGAGQAGVPLAKKLAEAGKRTALIEKRLVGGTCINDGCTPTKAMIASAKAVHQAKKASALGVDIGSVKIDFKKIVQRKNDIVEQFRSSSEKGITETNGLKLIFGTAKFSAEQELTITLNDGGEEKVTADWIFINTGAKTAIPDIAGLDQIDYLTSTTILDLETVPEHLVVIGGNYIGLEFGQMFSRFGSRVTILEKSAGILAKEDEDISSALTEILTDEKIEIITDVKVEKIDQDKKQLHITVRSGKTKKDITASHLLVAAGRVPQTADLGLENCGVKLDDKGHVMVNEKLETNIKGIYALGDVKGGPAFTHIAYNDYTIVYRNLIEGTKYSIQDRPVPYCMFTDPQLGRIGISEKEAKEKKLNYEIAVIPMSQVARGIETNETLGLMKAVVDPETKKILGAAILASEGGEIMSVLQMAMEGDITYDRIRYCVLAHPTYTESLNNLFMKLDR
ncbi:Pyruvate/2-oxoglutarate dehydrogenase complex, dihydrolipoamide dehydrogenase (E3) component [Pedobacter suwonensis]|uniref:Pyruvate/2-oxoglutarate dehydrogenase complex, dihydrolipoamide dehydrogenase (E3) component n=1 Tax=Pedobacter suwonensis TaxID=332999 RepID=A0A1I0SKL8_9SPHI|nr:mercuric reductase [Pedobacter suwonensis]SFA39306.1 Pyruvate/2-oxoglutarate dehydrogenase complex, dihydrolipoamide dehydrogenase (E3) component [Pedobacter suwonensis]